MRMIGPDELARTLTFDRLVPALEAAFKGGYSVPLRSQFTLPVEDGTDATLLVMPAWSDTGYIGLKTVVVAPENAGKGLPAVQASYLLTDRETGRPLAILDGEELTARRTAAASALAAKYLAPTQARTLLMIGTGYLSRYLPRAHASQRPIAKVRVWGRDNAKAEKTAADLRDLNLSAEATTDLETSVGWADIISSATLATSPLIDGSWLRSGQHIDLVGGFRRDMREADDTCVTRARLFCDTRTGALAEAGDLTDPMERGVINETDVEADLFDLVQGNFLVERSEQDITLFKSCGTAIEDLAAASLAYKAAAT